MSAVQEQLLVDDFFNDIPIEKVGVLKRFSNYIKGLFTRVKVEEASSGVDSVSWFRHFYEGMDINEPSYMSVRHASTLCDDALRVAQKRIKISKHLNFLNERLLELEAFINLTEEEVSNFKLMLDRTVALASERSVLLEKLANYDASLVDIEPIAEDARQVIPSIKDAEKHQRALRMDIGYLALEKDDLVNEHATMQKSIEFMHKVTIAGIASFFFIGLALILLLYFDVVGIFVPTGIFIFLLAAFAVIINLFRYKSRSEVVLNQKKQQKAVELLNKKSVVFAYYTNFLRFCYNKYKARNSRALENNLKDLESYRFLANRIDTVRSLMYETETEIERFLREKKLGLIKSTVEGFAKTINIDDKQRHYKECAAEKLLAEKTLVKLDKRHEEIWGILMELNKDDVGDEVNKVIDRYIDVATVIFKEQDNPEENKYEPRPVWKIFEMIENDEIIESE